ncbi:MAG: hypothetical protein M1827_005875 [Pycnora praestabilis]|nr:MAG: hypothetical protein M1827_005875 [Pycnora praestabilis]
MAEDPTIPANWTPAMDTFIVNLHQHDEDSKTILILLEAEFPHTVGKVDEKWIEERAGLLTVMKFVQTEKIYLGKDGRILHEKGGPEGGAEGGAKRGAKEGAGARTGAGTGTGGK